MPILNHIRGLISTPQTRPMPGRTDQAVNSAGGFVWKLDVWKRVERFLILGTEGGTFYISEQKLTLECAGAIVEALKLDGSRVVKTIVGISSGGRAPRNTPAVFALALAASDFADERTRALALASLPSVARTASDLTQFVVFARELRGWGRGLRSAVANWYTDKPASALAWQMAKYRERNGWSHRDLLRVAHPLPPTPEHAALFRWACAGELAAEAAPNLPAVAAVDAVNAASNAGEVVRLIETYRLTHEMVPPQWKNSREVWEALLPNLPYMALLRNLAKLTQVGVVSPLSAETALVVLRLTDRRRIEGSRVHPLSILSALAAYRLGRGVRGSLEWRPVGAIVDALDEAFHAAFVNVERTDKRIYLAIDASGSMQSSQCLGLPHVTAAMGAAAMAMSIVRAEPSAVIAAFHTSIWDVNITAKDRLDRAMEAIVHTPMGTDASLPMKDALDRNLAVDAFIIVTDNETWAGDAHPAQALAQYRKKTGIPAKLVVIAVAANQYSIADPGDSNQLDVAGFDATVPAVVADFLR